MAKFSFDFGGIEADLNATKNGGDTFSVDELLDVLRPAAMRLKELYKKAIQQRFQQRTGSLADSIDFDDNTIGRDYAFFLVKPMGTHKGGKYTRKSRAGPAGRKYAKHNRKPSTKALKNEELAYLLENGTPRIAATHWMENTNEESMDEIQGIIEEEYDTLLKKKGLIK